MLHNAIHYGHYQEDTTPPPLFYQTLFIARGGRGGGAFELFNVINARLSNQRTYFIHKFHFDDFNEINSFI